MCENKKVSATSVSTQFGILKIGGKKLGYVDLSPTFTSNNYILGKNTIDMGERFTYILL